MPAFGGRRPRASTVLTVSSSSGRGTGVHRGRDATRSSQVPRHCAIWFASGCQIRSRPLREDARAADLLQEIRSEDRRPRSATPPESCFRDRLRSVTRVSTSRVAGLSHPRIWPRSVLASMPPQGHGSHLRCGLAHVDVSGRCFRVDDHDVRYHALIFVLNDVAVIDDFPTITGSVTG